MEKRLTNSEDRHIKPTGTVTRVMAKNLMVTDTVLLAGNKTGSIVRVSTKVGRRGTYTTTYTVKRSNGKTFRREVDGLARIWIVEYPSTRFDRRNLSRINADERPHYTFK